MSYRFFRGSEGDLFGDIFHSYFKMCFTNYFFFHQKLSKMASYIKKTKKLVFLIQHVAMAFFVAQKRLWGRLFAFFSFSFNNTVKERIF